MTDEHWVLHSDCQSKAPFCHLVKLGPNPILITLVEIFLRYFDLNWLFHFPPHLTGVSALPWACQRQNTQRFCDRLIGNWYRDKSVHIRLWNWREKLLVKVSVKEHYAVTCESLPPSAVDCKRCSCDLIINLLRWESCRRLAGSIATVSTTQASVSPPISTALADVARWITDKFRLSVKNYIQVSAGNYRVILQYKLICLMYLFLYSYLPWH